ncbi:MAG: Holliday junction branch migration protein RuvA [Clostridia bacterium]|nr:Holliday junction branch migration protein RuvA [Clostridia bacterium]
MYYSISGIAEAKEGFLVIHNGGIGYKIYTSNTTLARVSNHQETTVYTYLNVKEDALDLYGFSTEEELSTFKMLLSVSGVGPKAALAVLSALTPTEFAMSVATQDAQSITRAQGVGKKMAEKIIVELKDKLKGVDLREIAGDVPQTVSVSNDVLQEAVNALMVLGYSAYEARQAVKFVSSKSNQLEEIIKLALKELM